MKLTVLLPPLALLLCGIDHAPAAITTGLTTADFIAPTIQKFQGTQSYTTSYEFGNGMTFLDLIGNGDLINLSGVYGLGAEPQVNAGKDGAGDRYFGSGTSPTTFQFSFADVVTQFGFFGAE